jgi:two-component system response regulator FixJ
MNDTPVVAIVDDEPDVCEALRVTIELMQFEVACFSSAKEFLERYDRARTSCLIVDLKMPMMSGQELLEELRRKNVSVPAIMISGHGDIPAAVRAVKAGAIDFLEKPYELETLREAIRKAIKIGSQSRQDEALREDLRQRIDSLTPEERSIMDLTIAGRPDKAIAAKLDLSTRTIQLRRASVMKKMRAASRTELTQLAMLALGPRSVAATDSSAPDGDAEIAT